MHYSAAHFSAAHFNAAHYSAMHYNTAHYYKVPFSAAHCNASHYSAVKVNAVHYSAAHNSAAEYSAALCTCLSLDESITRIGRSLVSQQSWTSWLPSLLHLCKTCTLLQGPNTTDDVVVIHNVLC